MLIPRILSALVMLPVAVAAIWFGGLAFQVLITAAAMAMGYEWHRMVGSGRTEVGTPVWMFLALFVTSAAGTNEAPATAVVGAVVVGIVVRFLVGWWKWPAKSLYAFGVPYITFPAVSLIWLRSDPAAGFETILWLLCLVWATDIGAYAFGRTIGGPKMAPRFSPKKTWAGLIGGVISAAATGAAFASWLGLSLVGFALLSGALAVVAQAGDIFESAVKRRFNVKDSSNIIPGHGGVLDRVDGVLPVAVVVAVVALVQGGGILTWRL